MTGPHKSRCIWNYRHKIERKFLALPEKVSIKLFENNRIVPKSPILTPFAIILKSLCFLSLHNFLAINGRSSSILHKLSTCCATLDKQKCCNKKTLAIKKYNGSTSKLLLRIRKWFIKMIVCQYSQMSCCTFPWRWQGSSLSFLMSQRPSL